MGRGRRTVLAVLLLAACAASAGAQDEVLVDGTLVLADWQAGAFGRWTGGGAALLRQADGSCRLEIAEGAADLPRLLDRAGRGWTLVLAAGGDAVLTPWGEAWSRLDRGLAAGLQEVAAAVAAPAPAPGAPRVRRITLPAPAAGSTLRAVHAARGRGRGGPGEVLRMVWDGAVASEPDLTVRSSRRPAVLRLSARRSVAVRYPAADLFVPLWPLRDLLEFAGEIPGTVPPAGR